MYAIKDIEDAIVAALAPLITENGVKTVKTYGNELGTGDDPSQLVHLFPAVYVVYGGSNYAHHGTTVAETMTFHVLACDRSLRGEAETRRGGENNPGTYVLLEAVRSKLLERQLSLDIAPLDIIEQMPIWGEQGISIYSATYQTTQYYSAPC